MSDVEATSRRRAATRERLVAAAVQVFARRGVLGASVEQICEAADFTRGAFYSNFDSRDELCLAIIEAQAERDLAAAREALSRLGELSGSLDELVDQAVTVFMSAMSSDDAHILAMNELRLYAAREPAIREAYRALQVQLSPAFGSALNEGLERLQLSLMLPVDEVIALLHAIHDQSALEELINGRPPNSPAVGGRLTAVLRAVIRPAK